MTIETTFGEAKPTYFVIREGGAAPKFKHPSRYLAEKEAERLAKCSPGAAFHVAKLKKTLVNTNQPATAPAEDAKAMRAVHAYQLIAEMGAGDLVQVRSNHYAYANLTGTIVGFATNNRPLVIPSVLVHLDGHRDTLRFQPQSLIVIGKAEPALHAGRHTNALGEQTRPFGAGMTAFEMLKDSVGMTTRAPRCGDMVAFMERGVERQGEIWQVIESAGQDSGFLIRDLIDNLILPRTYELADIRVDQKVEDRLKDRLAAEEATKARDEHVADHAASEEFGALVERIRKGIAARMAKRATESIPLDEAHYPGRYIEPGTNVYVIAGDALGLISPAVKAKLMSMDANDERMINVMFAYEDEITRVNASRVFKVGDPRIMAVA